MAAIVGGAAVLPALIGGAYLAVSGGEKEPAVEAGPSPEPTAEGTDDPGGEPTGEPSASDDPLGGPENAEDTDGARERGTRRPPADRRGRLRGAVEVRRRADADHRREARRRRAGGEELGHLDRPRGDGVCIGFGENQGRGFRPAVKCGNGDDAEYLGATTTKTSGGESVGVDWDEGGTDVLDWNG